jgi:hypothetical protein
MVSMTEIVGSTEIEGAFGAGLDAAGSGAGAAGTLTGWAETAALALALASATIRATSA